MRPRTDTQTDTDARDLNTFLVVYDSRENVMTLTAISSE